MSVSAHQHHPQSVPIVRHFTVQERIGSNPLLFCWCGAMMEVDYSYEAGGTSEARSRLNVFLDQHESCQPKGDARMYNDHVPEQMKYCNTVPGSLLSANGSVEYCNRCGKIKSITGGISYTNLNFPTDLCSCAMIEPQSATLYFPISPTDLDAIRLMVREEVRVALKDIVREIQRG